MPPHAVDSVALTLAWCRGAGEVAQLNLHAVPPVGAAKVQLPADTIVAVAEFEDGRANKQRVGARVHQGGGETVFNVWNGKVGLVVAQVVTDYLKARGCKIGGITQGERGMIWYDESGEVQRLPALPVPRDLVIDTSGAGDVFHGAYIAAFLANPKGRWREHFEFSRAASAYKIQHLGNEAGLPALADIKKVKREFGQDEAEALRPPRAKVAAMRRMR